jgi:hypothetical protein
MKRGLVVLPLLALILALGLAAAPARAQQFSADMIVVGSGQSSEQPRKIYVSNGKMRFETGGRAGGIMLTDATAKTAVMLMPQMKAYLDMGKMGMVSQAFMSVDPENPCPQWQEIAKNFDKKDVTWTCKRVGQETVNGRSTLKYQASSNTGEQAYAWVDPKLKFLVKSQDKEGRGMELKNIQEGAQPASLFEVPADYKKLDAQMMQQHGAKP